MNPNKNLCFLVCLTCSGCGSILKTEYTRPVIEFSSSAVKENKNEELTIKDQKWWDLFDDTLLSTIISATLQNNNDLHAAALRLLKSRIESGVINTNIYPDLDMSFGASSSRSISQSDHTTDSYSSSLSMIYELDLWGKISRTREQGKWDTEASEEDLRNTELLIIESVSTKYWSIARFNEQIEFNKNRLDIAKSTYELVKAKYDNGAGTRSDVLMAEKSIYSTELQLRNIISQRDNDRSTMITIYNKDSIVHPDERKGLGEFMDIELPLYKPIDIISIRPDIRTAELKIKMAIAGYDLARINFWPSVSLGATINAGSNVFTQWFSEQSLLQSVSATLPLLQWNKLNLQLQKERVSVELAINDFRKSVLNALSEVENALEARNKSQYALNVQKKALSISQDLMKMNEVKYKSGYITFKELLDSQDDVLNQRISYLDCQYDYLISTMKFLLSLGGGAVNKEVNDKHGT